MRRIITFATAAMLAAPVAAQSTRTPDLLQSSYALWGMMDAVANLCWEVADFEVSYMETHQNWLARNVWVRDELDAAAAAASLPAIAAEGEKIGADGILKIVRDPANAGREREICASWRDQTNGNGYEAETFLAVQLGELRERDGM